MVNSTLPTSARFSTLIGATLYMLILGTSYIIGSISPYLASYYNVTDKKILLLLPVKIFLQTLITPIGGKLAQYVNAKILIAIGAFFYLSSFYLASLVPRDQFNLFFVIFIGGQGICLGTTYMVPVKLGWMTFPNRTGLVTGIVVGGFGLGSLIFNKVSSKIANPTNLK